MASTQWSIITLHGQVLIYLYHNPDSTLRNLSLEVGVTERHVARIVRDLIDVGAVTKHKRGLRNSYTINLDTPVQHPVLTRKPLRDFVNALAPFAEKKKS